MIQSICQSIYGIFHHMRKREEKKNKMISPPLTSVRAGLNYRTIERGYFNVSLVSLLLLLLSLSLSASRYRKNSPLYKKNKIKISTTNKRVYIYC